VGQVAFYWNELHEALGELFALIVTSDRVVGMAVWYSTQNDRGQREMLRAALDVTPVDRWPRFPRAIPDITEVLDKTQSLSDRRNDALHTPFSMTISSPREPGKPHIAMAPSTHLGNPRAKKLRGKDLIAEFEFYARTAKALSEFVGAAIVALTSSDQPWPDKPRMPTLSLKKGRTT